MLRVFSTGWLFVLLVLLVSHSMAGEDIIVYKNESKSVTLTQQFSEYALGNDEIADIVVRRNDSQASEIVINGVEEGTTNLIFWGPSGKMSANFNILVQARDLGEMLSDIRRMIGGIPGMSAEVIGEKIVVKGEALTPQDMKTIAKLLKDNSHVINTVTLGASALKVMADIINDFVGGESQITVKPVGQTLVLYGTSYGKGSAKRVEEFANIFHLDVVNLIREKDVGLDPGEDKMIQVHAHFMEVRKKAVKEMGIAWSPLGGLGASGGIDGSKIDGKSQKQTVWQISGFFSNLLPKFRNDRERSVGRQLQVSSISVRSGEKGNFQSGGEIGYPVVSGFGYTTIVFKKYGMHIEILPIAQGDKITLKIKVKVNVPISLTAGGFLNFTNSEVETVQYCKTGDSVALSGLLGNFDRKIFDEAPGNRGALFELFSSKAFQKEESELIIFITPEVLAKAGDANMEIREKVMESFESYDPVSR